MLTSDELAALLSRLKQHKTQHGITLFDADIDEISSELDRRRGAPKCRACNDRGAVATFGGKGPTVTCFCQPR